MESNGGTVDRKLPSDASSLSKLVFGKPPIFPRKYSFPTAINNNNHLTVPSATENATKRRFSNVGDVVSRKLSTTIGWRSTNILPKEVISQGRVLCAHYIKHRLKRSGIFSKKLGLYRLRSMIGTTSEDVVREVSPVLVAAGAELERMYPKVYASISRQANPSPSGILTSDKSAGCLFVAIGHELLKNDITWGKIISIFAVAGGLAVDCVCQGHPEYIHGLVEGMEEIIEVDLVDWIAGNGGWITLCSMCKFPELDNSFTNHTLKALLLLVLLTIAYLIVRFCCRFV